MALAVVFSLEQQGFALPVDLVEQVVRVVAVTHLPKAPPVVQGIINFHGEIVPVMDIRMRLGFPPRAMGLSDQLIIARTPKRHMAFVADEISGVMEWEKADFVPAQAVVAGVEFLGGVVKMQDGLVLVYDPEAFFLPEETELLDQLALDHG